MGYRLFFLFLISPLFLSQASGKNLESSSLVFLYCDYLTSRTPSVDDTEKSWKELVRELESRTPFSKGAEMVMNPQFQACVEKNSYLFETGEFILDGKASVSALLSEMRQAHPVKPELLNVSFSFEDRQLSTQEFQMYLEDADTGMASANERIIEDLNVRLAAYESEWTEFIDALQSQTASSISSISLEKE